MGRSRRIKAAHLALFTALCIITGISGCTPKPADKKVDPPAHSTPTAPFQVQPLPNHIYGGLAGMTPEGDVLYFVPTAQQGRSFSWDNIGIWNPLTGVHSALMPQLPGYYAGYAVADRYWAVALYLPFHSSGQVPRGYLGQGWELVALNRHTGQHWIIAADKTGMLQGVPLPVKISPLLSLWGDQVIWTQYDGTRGQYHQKLNLLNLDTHVTQTIVDIPNAPLVQIDDPTIHGEYVAFCPSTIIMKAQPQASEHLTIMSINSGRIVANVQGGAEPAFSAHGNKVYFWYRNSNTASNGSIGVINIPGGKSTYFARPTNPSDMFWGPNAGNDFVSWYSSSGEQWAKVIPTGQWVRFPNQSSVNAVDAGGNVIAWSQLPQGNNVLPMIFAAQYATN